MAQLLSPLLGTRAGQRAEDLLEAFGSIASLTSSPVEAVARALGPDRELAFLIAAARGIVEAGLRERVSRAPVDTSDPTLLEYLRARLGGLADERLLVLFLDSAGGFIAETSYPGGAPDTISVPARTLFKRAFDLDSAAIVLAHNHPSGVAAPSSSDVRFTRLLADYGRQFHVELIDHLIVAGHQVTSMKRAGLIQ